MFLNISQPLIIKARMHIKVFIFFYCRIKCCWGDFPFVSLESLTFSWLVVMTYFTKIITLIRFACSPLAENILHKKSMKQQKKDNCHIMSVMQTKFECLFAKAIGINLPQRNINRCQLSAYIYIICLWIYMCTCVCTYVWIYVHTVNAQYNTKKLYRIALWKRIEKLPHSSDLNSKQATHSSTSWSSYMYLLLWALGIKKFRVIALL